MVRGSEAFGDGDGKVGEVGLLIPWRRPFSCVTAKERLYLHTTDAASLARTEHKTRDVYPALAINKEFQLAVFLTRVVEAHALRYGCPFTGLEEK